MAVKLPYTGVPLIHILQNIFFMQLPIRTLIAMLAAILCFSPHLAGAQAAPPRSYAVLSLVGNALHIYSLRPSVGTRSAGETRNVLDIADPVFDNAALVVAGASIKRLQPAARVVLMSTQDAELYAAQNDMFLLPEANKANRDYLIGLLKEQGVSHLILITKQRDNAYFALVNGSTGTGQLEGLGFYIDNTSRLQNTDSSESGLGMLGPFAYIRLRLLDATTLAVVHETRSNKSSIISPPSAEADALAIWTEMAGAEKIRNIKGLLASAISDALPALLVK